MTLRSLLSAGGVIAIGMIAGRVLGLLRETLLAAGFGTSTQASIAIALLIIPDFITNLMIGSAASAALVPTFATRDHARSMALFWQAAGFSMIAAAIVALAVFSQQEHILVMISADGASVPHGTMALFLALCTLPLSAFTAIITAWLQYRGRFLVPAFANAIFNIVVIAVLWLAPGALGLLAGGILAGALLRLGAHMLALARSAETDKPVLRPSFKPWQLDKALLKAYAATTGSGVFSLVPQYLPYVIIAILGSGIALFNYAFKLVLLPGMLLQTVIQMVLLPWLVRLRMSKSPEQMQSLYAMTLQVAWILTLAASLTLALVGTPLASLCFGYGRMTETDIAQVGHLFSLGVWSMPGMVLTSVWQQMLYANQHTHAPFFPSVVQAVFIVPLCWLGYLLAGLSGVMVCYAAVQMLTVALLARQGVRHGLIAQIVPSTSYIIVSGAVLVLFLPLALIFAKFSPPPLASVAIAGFIGIIILAAGLGACQHVRQWMRK